MNIWNRYQERTYGNDPKELLVEFLKEHNIKSAVDLGCGSGNETVYMAKMKIRVYAIDSTLNRDYILKRLNTSERRLVTFIEGKFEDVIIPKTDLVTANFSLPFCDSERFNEVWHKIYDSLETDGYFVGQLLGIKDSWYNKDYINTFTKDEINELLKIYSKVECKDMFHYDERLKKDWHYYNIIGRK